MMKKILTGLSLFFCIACIFYSCTSPLNPDTPRIKIIENDNVIPPTKSTKVFPKYFSVNVKVNSIPWKNSITDTLVVIDTGSVPPALWLHCNLNGIDAGNSQLPFLQQMTFRIDSLICNNLPFNLIGDPKNTQGAIFKIGINRDTTGTPHYVSVVAEAQNSPTSIQFYSDPATKQLHGQLLAKLKYYNNLEINAQFVITY